MILYRDSIGEIITVFILPSFLVTLRKLEKTFVREKKYRKKKRKKERRKSSKKLIRELKFGIFLNYNPFYDIFLIRNNNFIRNQLSF